VVFGWLIWRRNHSAAWYWLAALGFGMVTNLLFKGLLPISNSTEISQELVGYSFPSSHGPFSTLVFGFLAVLIAREIPPARRWIVYHLAAAFIIVPIAFARLYLGIHWLTDTLAGLCLGLIWVAVLGLAYNHHTTVAVNWRRLLATSLIALLAADLLHVSAQRPRRLATLSAASHRTDPRPRGVVETRLAAPAPAAPGFRRPASPGFRVAVGDIEEGTGTATAGGRLAARSGREFEEYVVVAQSTGAIAGIAGPAANP